jgi:sn-glycerol 3-phosphate transport system substrate-binding protein
MSHCTYPLAIAVGLTLSLPVIAAMPAKPASKQKATPAAQATIAEFALAHNLSPEGEKALQGIVERFNKENGGNLKVLRLEKGAMPVGLNIVSHYDMSDMLSQAKYFVPLHEMMTKAGAHLDNSSLANDLKSNVVDAKGRLVALPILYSTPVLFYNKSAFRKANLDPEQPPKTWLEMQGMLDKLQEAGYACPYTTAWPVWVHIDNVSAISGVPATNDKGGLSFNGLPQVKHVAMMSTWAQANYFKLFGRRNEASSKFDTGECAMLTTDSHEHVNFRDSKIVELGVAPMPFHDDVYGGRQASLADGASLWVGARRSPAEYKQAAKFVSFLMAPDIQIELVRSYGGLPLTPAARAAARSKLLRDGDQTLQAAYISLKGQNAKAIAHVADVDSVRAIVDDELELAWSDKTPSKAALDKAVTRGNAALNAKPTLKKVQPF